MSSQLYQFLLKKGLEPRKAQEEFFRIVHKTIEEGSISIVQAPTGTGKTYGYLIPTYNRKGRKSHHIHWHKAPARTTEKGH